MFDKVMELAIIARKIASFVAFVYSTISIYFISVFSLASIFIELPPSFLKDYF
jgi:hypothetical protein